MKIDFDELPPEVKFIYMSLTKSALTLQKKGMGKKDFVKLAEGIWDSMLMSDPEVLEETIKHMMLKDILEY